MLFLIYGKPMKQENINMNGIEDEYVVMKMDCISSKLSYQKDRERVLDIVQPTFTHIHFKVFVEGKEIITSQMFFPEVRGQEGFDEAYIMKLIAREANGEKMHEGHHDIVLP